jgi:hypothetical protein
MSGPANCDRAIVGPRPNCSLWSRTIALETATSGETAFSGLADTGDHLRRVGKHLAREKRVYHEQPEMAGTFSRCQGPACRATTRTAISHRCGSGFAARRRAHQAASGVGCRVLLGREGQEALVVLGAGRAAFEVRAHAREALIGGRVGEFQFHVAVQVVEALLAGEFGTARSDEPRH